MIDIGMSAQTTPAVPTVTNPTSDSSLPFTVQVKKTVVFLQDSCLHDFTQDAAQLTPEIIKGLPATQTTLISGKLKLLLTNFGNIPQSKVKLTPEESQSLEPTKLATLDIQEMLRLLVKMTSLSTLDLDGMSKESIQLLPVDGSVGTGFNVSYPDPRLAKDQQFEYLVTNRHVAQPGFENGHPCVLVDTQVLLNKRAGGQGATRVDTVSLGRHVPWTFPADDAVDLAAVSFVPPEDVYDLLEIPIGMFITKDMLDQKKVVEGDPVLFCGLFIQTFREVHRLDPIVRSGTLAMVPDGTMETTLHKQGNVLLADAHVFGGNSGSPVLVDINRFTNALGSDFRFLGVVAGELHEDSDLTLSVTTNVKGNVIGNSGVSQIVPAYEVRQLIDSTQLQQGRDALVRSRNSTQH
jgi:hypothetical protein